ncbi:MAG TPA: AraC family transcriptional regulator, partial [Cytophagales bacterium]|nr:AraC family transcriptional regulator [Cytophagales bacterium]
YLPTAEEMATNMLVSYKSLQRKLKNENTSYRELMNQIKSEYAFNMLQSKKFSITEVSEILGYADINSFSRAFKIKHGIEPKSVLHE